MGIDTEIARLAKELDAKALLPREDREMQTLAKAIAERLVPTAAPAPVEKADEAAEDRIAAKVAKAMGSAPTRAERWYEMEDLDPVLAGVFGPSTEEKLIAKAAAAPSIEELRKGHEAKGLDPALAGIFGGD